jgi:hypothetical protein
MAAEVRMQTGAGVKLLRPVDGPPCPECPYRRDVEPGIWPESVYGRLAGYDGSLTQQQATGTKSCMFCIRKSSRLCGGWIAAHPLPINFALQMQAPSGTLDIDAIRAYRPGVPVFDTGAAAVIHGLKRGSMLTGGTLLDRNRRDDRCDCTHRRFSHDDDGCVWCDCLMFKLEGPRTPRRSSADVDALAEEIVEAVKEWAKGDGAKLDQAAKILSVNPVLGKLPSGHDHASGWRCGMCDDCPVYRRDEDANFCKCGHSVINHAFERVSEIRSRHDKQEQPA